MNGVAIHPIANQDPSRRGLHLAQPWSEDVSRFICRYEVPVDDQWHEFEIHSEPLAVACRNPRVVEFWAQYDDTIRSVAPRRFIVVGTGHRLPERQTRHVGTAIAPGGALVWHLREDQS